MTVNSLGIHQEQDRSTRTAAEWLWALLPIGISVFCLSALVYYHVNHDEVRVASTLQVAIAGLYRSLGFAPACMFFLLLLTWSSIWFVTGGIERPVGRLARLAAMTVMLGVFMNLGEGGVTPAFHKGELGAWLADRLVAAFGYYPSLVLVWAVTFGSLLLATDYFFSERFESLRTAKQPPEAGVETEVTDHLKGLQVPSTVAPEPPSAVPETGSSAAPDGDVAAPTVDVPAAEPAYRPRRSYFERRYGVSAEAGQPVVDRAPPVPEDAGAAAAAGGADAADDDWVPTGPDAQEIEDPEPLDPERRAVRAAAADLGDDLVVIGEGAPGLAAEGAWEPVAAPEEPPQVEPLAGDVAFAAGPVAAAATGDVGAEPAGFASDPEPEVVVEARATDVDERARHDADLGATEAVADEPVGGAAADDEAEAAAASEGATGAETAPEPLVSIPRPDHAPVLPATATNEVAPRTAATPAPEEGREPVRQQRLFGAELDEALVAEAADVVTTWRRASATFLQRKLRIDYELACQLLVELAARGIVELEGDASRARVLG